jgi:hypothetical protein
VPEGFAGAIGSFRLRVGRARQRCRGRSRHGAGAGREPQRVRCAHARSGTRDFNIYPATAKFQPGDDLGLGLKSRRVVIPQNPELSRSLRCASSNPEQGKRHAGWADNSLVVRPGADQCSLEPDQYSGLTRRAARGDDIIHIKPRLELVSAAPLLISRPWFLVLQAVPPLLAGLSYRRRAGAGEQPQAPASAGVAIKVRED